MFVAYCETSVNLLRKNIAPSPPTIVRTPTPSGRLAAINVAKMRMRRSSVMGRETNSARWRSLSSVVLKARLMGTNPVPVIESVEDLTSSRSEL